MFIIIIISISLPEADAPNGHDREKSSRGGFQAGRAQRHAGILQVPVVGGRHSCCCSRCHAQPEENEVYEQLEGLATPDLTAHGCRGSGLLCTTCIRTILLEKNTNVRHG